MSVEVTCGKCGAVIYTMRMLKPVKDVVKTYSKCPSCGQALSASNFAISVTKT